MNDLTHLALRAQQDRHAVAAFIEEVQAPVWRLAKARCGDGAEDVSQDALIRIVRALPNYRGDAPALAWALRIARNAAADWVRAQQRSRRLLDRIGSQPSTDETTSPASTTDLELLIADVREPFREAFVLTQLIGLSYSEAASVCGCEIGTIRSRVARARHELVTALGDRSADGVQNLNAERCGPN